MTIKALKNKLRENTMCPFFFKKCYISIKFGSEWLKSLISPFNPFLIHSLESRINHSIVRVFDRKKSIFGLLDSDV